MAFSLNRSCQEAITYDSVSDVFQGITQRQYQI